MLRETHLEDKIALFETSLPLHRLKQSLRGKNTKLQSSIKYNSMAIAMICTKYNNDLLVMNKKKETKERSSKKKIKVA